MFDEVSFFVIGIVLAVTNLALLSMVLRPIVPHLKVAIRTIVSGLRDDLTDETDDNSVGESGRSDTSDASDAGGGHDKRPVRVNRGESRDNDFEDPEKVVMKVNPLHAMGQSNGGGLGGGGGGLNGHPNGGLGGGGGGSVVSEAAGLQGEVVVEMVATGHASAGDLENPTPAEHPGTREAMAHEVAQQLLTVYSQADVASWIATWRTTREIDKGLKGACKTLEVSKDQVKGWLASLDI